MTFTIQSVCICDAIRDMEPTIQKIEVCELIFHGVQSEIFHLHYFATYELLKKSLNAFRAAAISSIARRVDFHFWILGPSSRIASHMACCESTDCDVPQDLSGPGQSNALHKVIPPWTRIVHLLKHVTQSTCVYFSENESLTWGQRTFGNFLH